jgi:hypothetical protein
MTRRYNHILICVPTTHQTVKSGTMISIANAVKALSGAGLKVDLHNIDSAEIVTARDMFANMVLHSSTWDGLLFIDSDVEFDSSVVGRMLALKEDFAAATYPRRNLDIDTFVAQVRAHGNTRRAMAQGSSFTFSLGWDDGPGSGAVRDGFQSAAAVGMGLALISKQCLSSMVKAGVVKQRSDLAAGPGRRCWSFFDIIEADGERLGEDYSFCYRWTALMQKQLWVCIDEEVAHLGHFRFSARYSDLLF